MNRRRAKQESKKNLIIFITGFVVYITIEVVFNAFTGDEIPFRDSKYWSLFGVSTMYTGIMGACMLLILGKFSEIRFVKRRFNMFALSLVGMVCTTSAEFTVGFICNKMLHLGLWDYSHFFGNIMGLICVRYMVCWFLIAPFAYWLDDLLRYVFHAVGLEKKRFGVESLTWFYKQLFNWRVPAWVEDQRA